MATSSLSRETPTDDRDVRPYEVTVGILTALPVELRAMEGLVDDLRRYRDRGDHSLYRVGTVPSGESGRPHHVALLMMPRDGTQLAATCCANMLRTFPNIHTVIMTGIAGGIPRPGQPAKHVRLGDIVVALDGIVNYGSVRQEDGTTHLRGRQGAGLISNWLRQAAGELRIGEEGGDRQWERWLDPERSEQAGFYPRPAEESDVLYVRQSVTAHPPRPNPGPVEGMPRVHYGVVGSADVLMADEDFRDRLARDYPDMRAVEMEGTGIAASTAAIDRTWFMVRGVADYGERTGKNDIWHPYASYTAAAYVRTLLETAPPIDVERRRRSVRPQPLVGPDDQRRLDALLRRVPSDLDIARVWERTTPELATPSERLNTAAQAYHHLADLNADLSGLGPAIVFLANLSREMRDRDAELAGQLRVWVDEYTEREGTGEALRARLQSGSGAGPSTAGAGPLLLIAMAVDGIDRNRFRVASYLQEADGPWHPRLTRDQYMTRDQIERAVSESVAEAERVWAQRNTAGQAGIEFLLPCGLMNERVQWYPASPRLGIVKPICVRYPVAVRSQERMREPSVRREWANRWGRLDRQPFAGQVQWGIRYQPRPTTVDSWSTGLSGDDRYVVVVLSESPDTELGLRELFAALAAGVPVILWDQRSQHPAGEATDGLRRLTAEPARLPAEMRALRVQAEQLIEQEPDHYGRSVALLWDDPNRVVGQGVQDHDARR